MAYTQTNHHLSVATPLGKDVLLLTAFEGEEELSRPFRYNLEFLSEKTDIAGKDIVGQPISWTVQPTDGVARVYHGIVRSFSAGGLQIRTLRHYRAEVVPWLWFLTRNSDCRIFQNKTVPQIIEQVFKDRGFRDYQFSLQGSYPELEYCVQYRESDFDFISRLLEEYGIFYFFQHTAAKHALVLADQKSAYQDCAEKSVEFGLGTAFARQITAWVHRYSFRSGKWTQTDYNFTTPSASLMTDAGTLVKVGGNDKFEFYDYPGRYQKAGEGKPITKVRMEEEEAGYDVVEAVSGCSTFTPGGKFTLVKHECPGEKKGYVITGIRHTALDESHVNAAGGKQIYSNTFTCIPDSVVYRPPRVTPRPFVRGPQTAVVVGPKGEEIFTDKYGRVKVQFHWDRVGKRDENSSCWVRVAENWAGKNWGIVFNPRIGQEVIVDFLEGDPDRPIVTGRVYNAEQMPPYALPANQTQSVVKTRSSKNGTTDNFNELRFEDKKDSEEIYFHAEKDFNRVVENNDTLKVGSKKAPDGSQTTEVWKDRTETVKTGNEKLTIEKGDREINIDKGDDTHNVKTGKRTVNVQADDSLNVKQGNRAVVVAMGNDSHNVKMGNRDVQIDLGNDALTIKMGNQTTKLNLGASTTEALQGIELKVGPSSIKLDPTGVTIKGLMISVEGTIQTQVKGLMTQVSGTAMTQIQGAITMIG